jgi:hypothetical protein
MIYGFSFFKVNYLKFSLKIVNYYFITNAKKTKLIHAWAGGKAQNGSVGKNLLRLGEKKFVIK